MKDTNTCMYSQSKEGTDTDISFYKRSIQPRKPMSECKDMGAIKYNQQYSLSLAATDSRSKVQTFLSLPLYSSFASN